MSAGKPVSVSQVNAYLSRLIASDGVLSDIAVTGEVSNYKVHGSGHVYFSLKDTASRLDCFLPAGIYRGLDFKIDEGAEIIAEGYINVFEKGGRYSLTIRQVSLSGGKGDLARAFEGLKHKLAEKGYFETSRKKALPFFPLKIALVTSKTGAAVEDMSKIITARNSAADILIFPTLVQGDGAAVKIASRIRQINVSYPDVDVMIVGRGGGSAEDLWAFNEEPVADAIFESVIPVISAVGHETDFTISDFVADKRAETPTAAAVMAAPDTYELSEDLDALLGQIKGSLAGITSRLELRIRANNMDALLGRLKSGIAERVKHIASIQTGLRYAIIKKTDKKPEIKGRLAGIRNAAFTKAERGAYRLEAQYKRLEALNPLGVLSRGYAIVENEAGRAVGRAAALSEGENINALFFDGSVKASVREIKPREIKPREIELKEE